MVAESVMEDYKERTRAELRMTSSFAKDALRELRKGNFKVALTQVQEAEAHIVETKNLLKEMNHLSEMERTNNNVKKATMLAQEVNEKERELEELEKQLIQVKQAATQETEQVAMGEVEKDPETEI